MAFLLPPTYEVRPGGYVFTVVCLLTGREERVPPNRPGVPCLLLSSGKILTSATFRCKILLNCYRYTTRIPTPWVSLWRSLEMRRFGSQGSSRILILSIKQRYSPSLTASSLTRILLEESNSGTNWMVCSVKSCTIPIYFKRPHWASKRLSSHRF